MPEVTPWARAGRGDESARQELLHEHLGLVHHLARQISRGHLDDIELDELLSAGALGLTSAVDTFDAARGHAFSTFATPRIRGAILDELRRGDIMPRRTRKLAREIGATIVQLERQLARPPIDEEVAAALGVSIDEYKSELEQLVHVSVSGLEATTEDTMRSTDASPEAEASKRDTLRKIRAALPKLDARDLLVLSLYYNEELTYPEIGEVLRLTKSRVCQLHGRAIARLRAEMAIDTQEAA